MANKQGSCYITGRSVSSLEQKREAEVVQQADSQKEEALNKPWSLQGWEHPPRGLGTGTPSTKET